VELAVPGDLFTYGCLCFFLKKENDCMRKVMTALLLAGAAATWVGCQQGAGPATTENATSSDAASDSAVAASNGAEATTDSAEGILVTLNVPNMV
jgi:hypothetical protein